MLAESYLIKSFFYNNRWSHICSAIQTSPFLLNMAHSQGMKRFTGVILTKPVILGPLHGQM